VQVGSANEATCKEGLRECGRIDVAPLPWDTFGDPTNPRRYGDLIDTKNRFAGWKFGMPTNRYVPGPVSKRYWPGASMPEHTDRNPGPDPVSYSRTTSMSVLLSEPGEDFTGGEFLTPYGPVEAHLGDAIIFTAATRHQITPVESGERFVILAIGAWDGFNP
jgi:predicted 2-oxoglutarate/Fe(II)-dependent dioxygenase YbiX